MSEQSTQNPSNDVTKKYQNGIEEKTQEKETNPKDSDFDQKMKTSTLRSMFDCGDRGNTAIDGTEEKIFQ